MSIGGIFSHSQECNNGMLFEPHVFTAFHLDWHCTGFVDTYGFKVMYGGGEISVLSTFHYFNKKYDRGGKTFQPFLVS